MDIRYKNGEGYCEKEFATSTELGYEYSERRKTGFIRGELGVRGVKYSFASITDPSKLEYFHFDIEGVFTLDELEEFGLSYQNYLIETEHSLDKRFRMKTITPKPQYL